MNTLFRGLNCCTLAVSLTLLTSATAHSGEPVRLRHNPTRWWWIHGVTESQVTQHINDTNSRIIDLEIESLNPARFSAVTVENTGAYRANRWYWRHSIPGVSSLVPYLNEHNRTCVVDLEINTINGPNGSVPIYAYVVADDPQIETDECNYIYAGNYNGYNFFDLDPHSIIGGPPFLAGAYNTLQGDSSQRTYYYPGKSLDEIKNLINSRNLRIIDIERASRDSFNVIMTNNIGVGWYWHIGVSVNDVGQLLRRYNNFRIIDIEPYQRGGQKFFDIIWVEN
ncbi:hypothetical protein IQ260_28215 [Leptolyngbya cf. ectocarpi LEGE 11479]|uniref:Uncharacterized protein n=1 Tax=Leptolyngbya cf. ectocarpi LEGE 11479 TaxID=1828722 RepID=A0A928ZZT1_LEPEC|nr:hypothetical protein [Leptolyngbya ectocarpi]MBE9070534.1 hypothetical protein [Leptolyngbya cf. ectocarpi LEGE 11479]